MKSRYIVLLSLLLILASLNPALAEENSPISMDFRGADIRDVFRTLAQIAGENLIIHQSVQGEVTISLDEVPFEEAINLLTIINDLEYKRVGNTILVAQPGEIVENFSQSETKTLDIQYAKLEKIKEVMENFLKESSIVIDKRTRQVVVSGDKGDLAKAEKIVAKLDVPISQVFLDVRVEEISNTGLSKAGVPQGNYAKLKILNSKGFVTDISVEFPNLVEALKQEGMARTLANPGLVTLDGQTSKLLIGDKVPVKTETENDGKVTSSIKYIDAGIKLEFTPQISEDGYITLEVKPQISSIGEYLTKGYPLIKSREFETVVRIKDGETFVMGGLVSEEDRESLEKVPILGEIPILKALFQHKEKSNKSSEVIIFITPRIIYPGDEGDFTNDDSDGKDTEKIEGKQGTKEEDIMGANNSHKYNGVKKLIKN